MAIPVVKEAPIRSRIIILDILRGFALYGIILAHAGSVYLYELGIKSSHLNGIDVDLKKILEVLIERKFYLIFSFLFGLSFFIQLENTHHRQQSFVFKYLWRLFILFLIGLIHSLLYPFDILRVYALTGILLLPIKNLTSNKLLSLAIVLFISGCLFLHFNGHIKESLSTFKFQKIDVSATFSQQIASGHLFTILSLFILGLWAGKKEIFRTNGVNLFFFKSIFLISLISLILLKAGNQLQNFHFLSFHFLNMSLTNISLSCLYVSTITLFYSNFPKFKLLWKSLEVIGKMGLTNYVMQTIFFFTLFKFKHAFFAHDKLALLIVLSNLFYLSQILFSIYWLKKFKIGPLEWIWRTSTNLYKPTNLPVKDSQLERITIK